jgi:hypothetical protein
MYFNLLFVILPPDFFRRVIQFPAQGGALLLKLPGAVWVKFSGAVWVKFSGAV